MTKVNLLQKTHHIATNITTPLHHIHLTAATSHPHRQTNKLLLHHHHMPKVRAEIVAENVNKTVTRTIRLQQ